MTDESSADLRRPLERFEAALKKLQSAAPFAKSAHAGRLLDSADRILQHERGIAVLYDNASAIDAAGAFSGTDWDQPGRLQARFVNGSLNSGDRRRVTIECLSLLRILAISEQRYNRPGLSAEQAGHYLREVLALNIEHVFDRKTEASRQGGPHGRAIRQVMQFVAETIGYDTLLDQLVEETWRLLRQRPIQVDAIREMVTKLSVYCYDPEHERISMPAGSERLISSLYMPSPATREDPGLDIYTERLFTLDANALYEEAAACARSMHDTGLVSPYHAVLVRHLLRAAPDLIGDALGLSSTGLDSFLTYRDLTYALIDKAVHPETCQCLYGLAALLERAVLHNPSVAASLWRQLRLPLSQTTQQRIIDACGGAQPADVFLLAGAISILGQPLGVGQGDNPTCQAARAISYWAYADPDYLLQLLTWAARDDGVLMMFHGKRISSAFLPAGAAGAVGKDLDPVSMVLAPHLDRVYAEMGRLASSEHEDPHIHVNPEFHGWRVGGGFAIAVNVESGRLQNYEDFVRLFYACYHPAYNGGQPLIHPQPVGIAVTDALERFIGWHAITLLRVALDQRNTTRVYFFNPNNDSGQDWGGGVRVSTEGCGEQYGESSLPIEQFVSRLYLFHYDLLEVGDKKAVPQRDVDAVMEMGKNSWAAARGPRPELVTSAAGRDKP